MGLSRDAEIRAAKADDFAVVADLLGTSGLPLDGLREHFAHALVATEAGKLVGCVALEPYGSVALLRSLAVRPDRRGQFLGETLTSEALSLARRNGIRDVYLLTETAADFFPRFGFMVEDRLSAPKDLEDSAEFRFACPASAVFMHARVAP